MLETTARSAHCQSCTNCSRQYCTADYIHDSTTNKLKIWRDAEAHTRQQIIFATYRMIEQKCHEGGIKMWTATTDFTKAFDSRRRFSKTRYWLMKKATCSRSRKEPNRVIFCQACFSTCFCRKHWKTTFRAGTRKKVWEFTLVTMTMTASQTWDLPTTCSCLHPPKKSFKNMLYEFKKTAEKVGLRIQKKIEVDNIKKSKYWQEDKAWDTWARWLRSCNRRRPKSEIESGLPGRHFTSRGRNWHRKTSCSNIDSGCSKQWQLRRYATHREHGHPPKSTRVWYSRRNAKCSDSSYKRKEDTKWSWNKKSKPT